MLEVGAAVRVSGQEGPHSAGQAGDQVLVELVGADPLPAVEFVPVELDAGLVVAQWAAVEDEQQFEPPWVQ